MGRSRETLPDLRAARHEIEQIDRALVLLVAARIAAAETAIRIRSRRDGRVSDPAQELIVLARARLWAEQAGLPEWLVETIFRAVVRGGKERFASAREDPARPRTTPGASRARRGPAITPNPPTADGPIPDDLP